MVEDQFAAVLQTLTAPLSSVIVLFNNRISSAVAAVVRLSYALSPNACLTSEEKEF
jgi:hypothetical protein